MTGCQPHGAAARPYGPLGGPYGEIVDTTSKDIVPRPDRTAMAGYAAAFSNLAVSQASIACLRTLPQR